MDIAPTPEFREACWRVLDGDDPATVVGAIMKEAVQDELRALHADLVDAKQEGKSGSEQTPPPSDNGAAQETVGP